MITQRYFKRSMREWALVTSDAGTETSSGFDNGTGTDSATGTAVPAPRTPWEGATSSAQSGPFTGLVAALKTVTAPRPVVPARKAPPSGRRLLAICGWAALLDLAGLVIGVRGAVTLMASTPPHWYLPSLLISGAAGIAVTSAAFLSVRLRLVPWILLLLGTAALITSAALTSNAG
jgi:hypothetical protein